MALLLHYIGTAASGTLAVAWRQNKPPAWGKSFAGEADTCSLTYQGPQYKEKDFCDALVKYQALVYIDENGTTTTDNGMRLIKWSSDDSPIFPTVTLTFTGCRGSTPPDAVPTDDVTLQSASTTKTITDPTSPNYEKAITMEIQYYAARTSWEWSQLSNPAGTPAYGTVRYPLSYSLYGPNTFPPRFSGMVDASGLPSNTISTADATAVWNTLILTTQISGFTSKEIVPGYVWQCNATAEKLLIGT